MVFSIFEKKSNVTSDIMCPGCGNEIKEFNIIESLKEKSQLCFYCNRKSIPRY
ncbi:MAG TPA: hypothetical protein VMZ29_17000 [Candidatus Bathyarchaeia archaeon]|nr:hypothetical protein [Candidatus Bathyarchaeia archaeon]